MTDVIRGERGPNPFDPAALRLDPSYAETLGVKKLLTTVPVRKPNRQEFVQVHPEPAYRLVPAATIALKEEGEVYLVTPQMARELSNEIAPVCLSTTMNRQGVLFLWPVKLPDPAGRPNSWLESAGVAAERAMGHWVRVASNRALGAYEISVAIADLPEPEWPDLPFDEVLKIAFREHIVDRLDHPLVKQLRGEV